nr:hypothetical protein [Leptospira jelokensis]
MRPLAKNFYLSIFLVLIAMASTNCKPADLESTCDVKSESFLLASLVRLATGDRSPSCLPAFSFLEEWGVYVSSSTPKVRSILSYRNHILMGGDFNKVGLSTGSVAVLDKHSGTAIPSRFCPFLKVKGETYAAVPDGSGGFYIGGSFTHVQGIKRSQVAHILPGCQLDPNFNVTEDASRNVNTLHILGDNLYIGGTFSSWGSSPQTNIAAVNRYTGELYTSFYIGSIDGFVGTIVSFGNSLFIGGNFQNIAGISRDGLAKLNSTTGSLDTIFTNLLSPGATVNDLFLGTDPQGSPVLYVGGTFNSPRNNAAAFFPDGTLSAWAPNPNATVEAIQQYENTIYLGGSFTSVLGAPTANYLVGVDNGTGNATKNDFAIDLTVTSLHLVGNQLYALGQFTMAKGITRNYAAAFEVPSGALTNWNPSLDEAVSNPGGAVIPFGNDVVLGFNRYGVNLIQKKNFVVFDEATGYPLDNTPEFDFGIVTMHLKGDRLFLGGSFETINGNPRLGFAAIDLPHYQLNPTNFELSGLGTEIRAITSGNGQIFFGGYGMTIVKGQTRNAVAAISEETLALTQWNPNLDTGSATSLLVVGDAVFIGGLYTSLNGNNTISNYRAVDTVTGTAISLPSTTNYPQNDVIVQTLFDGKIYLGGSFTTISGLGAFNNFAIYDLATNSYQNSIYANGFVNAITPAPDGRVLVGGSFTGLNGSTTTPNVSAFQTGSYNILNWAPNPDSTVYTSFYHNGKWYVGGEFKDAFNKAYGGFFRTDLNEPPSN